MLQDRTYNQVVAALQKEKLNKQQLRHKFIVEQATVDKLWLRRTRILFVMEHY